MGKYYCDYCDTYLTHDSPSVRKTHNSGRKHKENVRYFYQKWVEEQAQSLIDQTTAQGLPPGVPMPMVAPGMLVPPPLGMVRQGMLPHLPMPGVRPGMPGPGMPGPGMPGPGMPGPGMPGMLPVGMMPPRLPQ